MTEATKKKGGRRKARRPLLTAREMLKKEYGDGPNFMTPDVIKVGKAGTHRAWELASGPRIFGTGTMYGVTVLDYDPDRDATYRRGDLRAAFFSRKEAEKHIENLPELNLWQGDTYAEHEEAKDV